MDEKVKEILDSLDPSALRVDAGRFASKLTFNERCSVLAAFLYGVNRRVLSLAFGINRRTVTHIYNPNSPHYKATRQELERLGKDRFIERYLTEDVVKKIAEVKASRKMQVLIDLSDSEISQVDQGVLTPTKRRSSKAGFNNVKPEWCSYSHRVHIAWVVGHFGEGWYYQDLDGPFPDQWMHSGKESIVSSTAALKGAEENVVDKL